MSSFNEEMNAGFAELANEAGPSTLSFGGVALPGVFDGGMQETMRADTKLGGKKNTRLAIARTELAKLAKQPAAGDYFALGADKLRIESVEDDDPTDTTVVFVVKVRG